MKSRILRRKTDYRTKKKGEARWHQTSSSPTSEEEKENENEEEDKDNSIEQLFEQWGQKCAEIQEEGGKGKEEGDEEEKEKRRQRRRERGPKAEETKEAEVEGEGSRGQETTIRRRISGEEEEQNGRENKRHIPDTLEQQLGKFIEEEEGKNPKTL